MAILLNILTLFCNEIEKSLCDEVKSLNSLTLPKVGPLCIQPFRQYSWCFKKNLNFLQMNLETRPRISRTHTVQYLSLRTYILHKSSN
jgi:hypothetical protein